MAWQSGMTGIGYDPKKVGHQITSWDDRQDSKLKGKDRMFGDNQTCRRARCSRIGRKPEDSTQDDWHHAADWLKKQHRSYASTTTSPTSTRSAARPLGDHGVLRRYLPDESWRGSPGVRHSR